MMALNRLLFYAKTPLAAVGAVFLLVYFETIVRVVKDMFSYQGSHGIIILAISLYMVWMKRLELRRRSIEPSIGFGIVITTAGCFILLFGKMGGILILQEMSLLVTLSGLIFLILGPKHFQVLVLPLVYLIFMFPLFENITGGLQFYLQLITANIASCLLTLMGIPTYQSSLTIALPHMTLLVARTCSGVNHIIALVAVTIFLSFLTQQSMMRKALFALAAFLIGVLSNGLRVALIGLWAEQFQGELLHGPFDMLYVAFIFFFGLAVIFLLGVVSGQKITQIPYVKTDGYREQFCQDGPVPSSVASMASESLAKPQMMKPLWKGGCAALIIMLTTVAFLHFWKPVACLLERPLYELPASIDGWVRHDIPAEKDRYQLQPGDWVLKRVYKNPSGRELQVLIVYYAYQDNTRGITDFRYRWIDMTHEIVPLQTGDGEVRIKKVCENKKDLGNRAYFWYDINGRILLNYYSAKGAIILDSLTKRCTSGALVSIQATSDSGRDQSKTADETSFIRALFPIVREHLKK